MSFDRDNIGEGVFGARVLIAVHTEQLPVSFHQERDTAVDAITCAHTTTSAGDSQSVTRTESFKSAGKVSVQVIKSQNKPR